MNDDRLIKLFKKSAQKVIDSLRGVFLNKKTDKNNKQFFLRDIKKILKNLNEQTNEFIEDKTLEEFVNGADSKNEELLEVEKLPTTSIVLDWTVSPEAFEQKAPKEMIDRVEELTEHYTESFDKVIEVSKKAMAKQINGVLKAKKEVNKITTNKKKKLDVFETLTTEQREKAIEKSITTTLQDLKKGVSFNKTVEKTAKKIAKIKDARDIKDVMFYDRAGRKWQFVRYAEMRVRDIEGRSFREGEIQQALEIADDLDEPLLRTGKTTKTPFKDSCDAWENTVVALDPSVNRLKGVTSPLPLWTDIQNDPTHMGGIGCRHSIIYVDPEIVAERLGIS